MAIEPADADHFLPEISSKKVFTLKFPELS
jgi:hypothetical protein